MRIRVYEDYDSTNAQSPLSVFEIGDFNTYKPSVFNSNNNTCDYDCDDYCEDEYCDIVDDIVDDIIDDFTDCSDIDNDEYIDVNDVTDDVQDENDFYEDLEALGFVFILASNDIHTIHVNACGENFKELHESCDELYKLLNDYADKCLEMCCEDGHFIHNINSAKELIDGWENRDISNKGYNICKGTQIVIDVLHDVTISIQELYPYVTSDIQSTMDEWTRTLNSKMNYFLGRVVEVNHIFSQTN
jgi:DNA-binding ferritin-like protein